MALLNEERKIFLTRAFNAMKTHTENTQSIPKSVDTYKLEL